MKFSENLRLAWSCVRANKMRSILTMLGIIIGISAVITISTIGSSLRQTIQKSITGMLGANQLAGVLNSKSGEWSDETYWITLDDLKKFKDAFPEVTEVCGSEELGQIEFQYKKNNTKIMLTGKTEGALKMSNLEIISGHDLTFEDSLKNRNVAVVSDLFVKYGLGGENPIGKKIDIKNPADGTIISVYIVGVYKYDQNKLSFGQVVKSEKDIVTPFYIPLSTAFDFAGTAETRQGVMYFYFFSKDGIDPTVLMDHTSAFFNTRILPPNSDWELNCQSLEQQLSQINTILNVVTVAISVIAAISLIVGGIGVMNIMLVSVVERTKEIGIRKALGAKNRTIEGQFLVEAVMICAIGGLIGIVLGLVNGGIITIVVKQIVATSETYSMLQVVVRPPVAAILVSFIFSMAVGVVFGHYPARRAARLSPIDALRYE